MSRDFVADAARYYTPGNIAALNFTHPMSFAAWWVTDATASYRTIMGKYGGPTASWIFGSSSSAAVRLHNANEINLGTYPAVGALIHTGAAMTASASPCYVNGVLVGTGAASTYGVVSQAFRIGTRPDNIELWDGRLCDVAIWNIDLNAREFAALAKGISPFLIRPLNLRGYWPLWGTSGTGASPDEIDLSTSRAKATGVGAALAVTRQLMGSPGVL